MLSGRDDDGYLGKDGAPVVGLGDGAKFELGIVHAFCLPAIIHTIIRSPAAAAT
jgi:hypothetical protein